MNEIIRVQGPEVLTAIPRSPDQNAAFLYLASLSARSGRNTQKQVLTVIAGWLGGTLGAIEWGNLRYAHCIAIKSRLLDSGYSPASARKFLCALRGTMRNAWKLGQINAEDYNKAIDLGAISGHSLPAGRYIPEDEMGAIFDSCVAERTPNGARDAALFAILYGCGLRREELVNLNLDDYRPTDGTLTVRGKRGRTRLAYITNGTLDALNDWLEIRGQQPGPLFLAVNKTHKVRQEHRLTPQMVYNTVSKRGKACGLETFSPHSLRRSFCSKLLDSGVDISTASKLMGHSNLITTQIYDRRGDRIQQEGATLLHIPYKKRKEAQ